MYDYLGVNDVKLDADLNKYEEGPPDLLEGEKKIYRDVSSTCGSQDDNKDEGLK